jgi:glycosyltransferase involved in cell wall biosynthesis
MDTCPLVVIEALSVGCPIISFATAGIPEIVEHKKN